MEKRILIAEDSREMADSLSAILKMQGYMVDVVWDGVQAMNQIQTSTYDLIIVEETLPRISGKEIIGQLYKVLPDAKSLCIISSPKISMNDNMQISATMTLVKPFKIDEFLFDVKVCFDENRKD